MTLIDVLLDDLGINVEDVMDQETADDLSERVGEAHALDIDKIDPPD